MFSVSRTGAPRQQTSRKPASRVIAVLAIALGALASCASPQTERLRESPGAIAQRGEAPDTRFIAQPEEEAGSAAFAMVLRRSGVAVTREQLAKEVYAEGRGGDVSVRFAAAVRQNGRLAYPIRDLRSVFREIDAGRPVVVLLNVGLPWIPSEHYAVVIGYDLGMGTVTLHSGQTARKTMPMGVFERTWERAGYWGVLVLEPGRMPAPPVRRADYMQAVHGLEYAGWFEAARKAYVAALREWPRDLWVRMGLGNTLYVLARHEEAAQTFASAVRYHPNSAAAHNSLARVLMELGDLELARIAAQTAVALNGPDSETYRRTLKAIESLEGERRRPPEIGAAPDPPAGAGL